MFTVVRENPNVQCTKKFGWHIAYKEPIIIYVIYSQWMFLSNWSKLQCWQHQFTKCFSINLQVQQLFLFSVCTHTHTHTHRHIIMPYGWKTNNCDRTISHIIVIHYQLLWISPAKQNHALFTFFRGRVRIFTCKNQNAVDSLLPLHMDGRALWQTMTTITTGYSDCKYKAWQHIRKCWSSKNPNWK